MGYDTDVIRIPVRLSSHNDEQDAADREALDDLEREITMLIDSDPRYSRITETGRWES